MNGMDERSEDPGERFRRVVAGVVFGHSDQHHDRNEARRET